MKIIYITLFLLISGFLFGEISFISGFINDNYTGSTENGVNGNYIGADDFLTFSLFAKSTKDNLTISEYYQLVTSRKFEYRYDLLETEVEYFIEYGFFDISPRLLIIYKGNFNGQYIQNAIHESRDLPLVDLDYTDPSMALGVGGNVEYEYNPVLFRLDLEIPYSIKPIYSMFTVDLFWENNFIKLDLLGGYKQYINSVDEYSDFVESGFIGGAQVVIKPNNWLTVNAGAFFFPSNNLENDELYEDIDHSYSPQFWVTFGINGGLYDILDIVNF